MEWSGGCYRKQWSQIVSNRTNRVFVYIHSYVLHGADGNLVPPGMKYGTISIFFQSYQSYMLPVHIVTTISCT